ncbi:hypothetical protein I588_02350 [Enterococcus pallens ATCC BAA-351]|uniref:Uncharacterized protein n=1 Tax=Enterococcus pallens ATCC BAA-351 TaxID=1158607 RepID=R2SJG5_9ENTE|nr:hypothetical protein UAU_01322 [Enterococcus pallens ATCC BAA-351]EOU21503.1 hypothetical protein I588_02350 [Enterococcus pallens ATCC BAA-351]OJG79657.1 hypothetical protein RV10_GL000445 [Enterococcus pallens]
MGKILTKIKAFFLKEKKSDSVVKTPSNQPYANAEVTNKLKKLDRKQKKKKRQLYGNTINKMKRGYPYVVCSCHADSTSVGKCGFIL